MKILVCGMPRSMTTWAFNIISSLLSEKPKSIWIDPNSSQEEDEFVNCSTTVLAKCHHFSDALAEASDLVFYSYRDIRYAAISCRRKFSSPCSRELLNSWVIAGQKWQNKSSYTIRYEWAVRNMIEAVQKIRECLEEKGALTTKVSNEEVLLQVEALFSKSDSAVDTIFNSDTLIHPKHRTNSPLASELSGDDLQVYKDVSRDFSDWLRMFGYIDASDYGQEIDYTLAECVIKYINAKIVVDVGAEKGTFTDIALASGVDNIYAFEPLPRHIIHLNNKYKSNQVVKVIPVAVSSVSGHADLHIAVDSQGKELDFHHTLSNIGNSAEVNRVSNTLNVDVISLKDFSSRSNDELAKMDFLKIDTDGHDLDVLIGLGDLRPKVIIAEYWNNLPETSGINNYFLSDLNQWALGRGYTRNIVIRRNGRFQEVQFDAEWSVDGDWGNVFFIHESVASADIIAKAKQLSQECHSKNVAYCAGLIKDCEEKESVIRQLGNLAVQNSEKFSAVEKMNNELIAKESIIQELKQAYDSTMLRLQFLEKNGNNTHG
jgi:FkbM family methyltransferase